MSPRTVSTHYQYDQGLERAVSRTVRINISLGPWQSLHDGPFQCVSQHALRSYRTLEGDYY